MRRRRRRGVHARPAHGGRRGLRGRRGGAGVPGVASDVRLLADELERIHPNPYHAVSREEFRRQVDELAARADGLDRDELIVGLMQLMGLLGERDGHSGIYTLHSHPRPMHLYPVRVYWFADGLAAVGGRNVPPGAKLVAVGGVPIDDVVARVRPLITRDNEWSFRERVPYYLVCAEVLHGLGIARTFTFETPQGGATSRRRRLRPTSTPTSSRTSGRRTGAAGRRAAPALGPLPGNRAGRDDAAARARRVRRVHADDGLGGLSRRRSSASRARRRSDGSSSTSARTAAATTRSTGRSSTRSRARS